MPIESRDTRDACNKLDISGVTRYDREELAAYFLAFSPPDDLANHKQVYSIQPLPPETLSINANEPLADVNSTAVPSYQRGQKGEARDSAGSRRRKNRPSIPLDDEEGREDDGWTPMSKDLKAVNPYTPGGAASLRSFKKSDSPRRNLNLSGSFETQVTPPAPIIDDFSFDFEEEEDDDVGTSFLTRGGFIGKSVAKKDNAVPIPEAVIAPTEELRPESTPPIIPPIIPPTLPRTTAVSDASNRPPPPPCAPPPPPTSLQIQPSVSSKPAKPAPIEYRAEQLEFERTGPRMEYRPELVKSPPPPPSNPIDLRLRVWRYRDPQGVIQGPFSTLEMQHWNDLGYFTSLLPLQHVDRMDPFLPLKALFPKGLQPFRSPPITFSPEMVLEYQREEIERQEKQRAEKERSSLQLSHPVDPRRMQVPMHTVSHTHSSPTLPLYSQRQQQPSPRPHVPVAPHHLQYDELRSSRVNLEQQSANIKTLLQMNSPGEEKATSSENIGKRSPEKGPNGKRDRRKKDKDEEEKDNTPPFVEPVKPPMLQSTAEFPSLGSVVPMVPVTAPPRPAPAEPEGFWERPPRPPVVPAVDPVATVPEAQVAKEKPKVAKIPDIPSVASAENLEKNKLPRRKRGKGIAADPKLLGFVAPHRGTSIDTGKENGEKLG